MEELEPIVDALMTRMPGLELAHFDATGAPTLVRGRRTDRGIDRRMPFPPPLDLHVADALVLARTGEPFRREVPDGEGGMSRITAGPWGGAAGGVLVTVLDVTAAHADRRRADAYASCFFAAFDHAPVPMTLLRADLRTLRVNDATCALTGYPRERLEGAGVPQLFDPDELGPLFSMVAAVARGDAPPATLDHTLVRADGRRLLVRLDVRIVALAEGGYGALMITTDLSSQQSLADELEQLTTRDPLTGLLNRDGLEAALDALAQRGEAASGPDTLLVADVDDFALVNAALGSADGDLVLAAVAQALSDAVRTTDPVARIGGDEFAILLAGQDLDQAGRVADAVLARFGEGIARLGGEAAEADLSLSIGVAAIPPGTTPSRAIAAAGIGVYAAKVAGKGRWAAGL